MQDNDLVTVIQTKVVDLHKLYIETQAELVLKEQYINKTLDQVAIKNIEILDFIEDLKVNLDPKVDLMLTQILKKLNLLLKELGVEEILLKTPFIVDPKLTKVVDTRKALNEDNSDQIIEICRRGFTRSGRVIRPVEVITGS